MSFKRWAGWVWLAVTLTGLAACAGRPESRATGLLDVLRKHHDHLRWENYGGAGALVATEFRPAWLGIVGGMGRVSEYELGDIDLQDPPGTDAFVTIRMSGFRIPDLTVRTRLMREHWHRDRDNWRLTEMSDVAMTPTAF